MVNEHGTEFSGKIFGTSCFKEQKSSAFVDKLGKVLTVFI